ncbi:MAG TPA: hypothetical protein VFV38_46330 [Ktedonobacteraceae bacterium]|nr:hypothetical protein [Ktedonobacteraceae bacterium]
MRGWVRETEALLSGQWAPVQDPLNNQSVGRRFDAWCSHLAKLEASGQLSEQEQRCLTYFLQVTADLRPRLIQCYNIKHFPRTNNDLERFIRSLKTRYRRVSGRKNWNAYLLRYGRCIAWYDGMQKEDLSAGEVERFFCRVGHRRWREMRAQCRLEQREQLNIYRFRHRREWYLSELEARWATAAECTRQLH